MSDAGVRDRVLLTQAAGSPGLRREGAACRRMTKGRGRGAGGRGAVGLARDQRRARRGGGGEGTDLGRAAGGGVRGGVAGDGGGGVIHLSMESDSVSGFTNWNASAR